MKGGRSQPILPILQVVACSIIILSGVRAASPIPGPLLLSLLLVYTVVPFPKWLMLRFKFHKSAAIVMTAVAVVAFGLYILLSLDLAAIRIAAKLPIYEQRLAELYDQVTVFMNAHGILTPSLAVKGVLTVSASVRFRARCCQRRSRYSPTEYQSLF